MIRFFVQGGFMFLFKRAAFLIVAMTGLFFAGQAMAAGPHEGLDCLGCHDPHYAKSMKIFKVKNEVYPNPRTGKPIDGISALCLGCHNLQEYGGAGVRPIYLHMTHPVNVQPNKQIASVPDKLLRDGILQCVSCHDPHPSNQNWRYLRVNTDNGGKVGQFCGVCHGAKADKAFYGGDFAAGKTKVFSSMNEEAGAGSYEMGDNKLMIANPTPNYIQAHGPYENQLDPAYTFVIGKNWYFEASQQNQPDDLKAAIQNATPEQISGASITKRPAAAPAPAPRTAPRQGVTPAPAAPAPAAPAAPR
jgi:predicted CXXCH cytochrome family protein